MAYENCTSNITHEMTNQNKSTGVVKIFTVFIYCTITFGGVLTNLVVIGLFQWKASLLRKPYHRLLCSLSVCDVLASLSLIPTTINMVQPAMQLTYKILAGRRCAC